ncbi:MAG: tetratricopeptide repeat protein [Oscillochloris sp.]|nr:tetratricopeptide repeat protein [Oscillochloris sp.]
MRSAPSVDPKTVALAVIGVIAIGLLGLLFWPRDNGAAQTVEPTSAFLPPTSVAIAPTATLLPATPTPDSAVYYQEGLAAYNAGDWPKAVAALQQVYTYDAHYQDVSQVLGAALYNWGIAMRDQGDIAGAIERFASTITVDPTHPLATGEQQKAQLYLDALSVRESGNLRDAAIKLEELRDLQGDYLDSAAQLYNIYLAYGGELEAQKQKSDALRIYEKAAALPLEDVSVARAKLKELAPPTPTPTPKRLRFSVANYNDTPSCISIRITGIGTGGWYFTVDGIGGVVGSFDSAGNARACGLGNGQEVTVTIHSADGKGVAGGSGVPSKGSAIMVATWR